MLCIHVQGETVEDRQPWRQRHYDPSNCQDLQTKWRCHNTKKLNLQQHHCKNLKSCILIFCSFSHGNILASFSSSEQKFGVCEIFVKSIIQAIFLICNINIKMVLIPVQYTFLFNENQRSENIIDFKTFTFKFSSNTYCIWKYPQTNANPM